MYRIALISTILVIIFLYIAHFNKEGFEGEILDFKRKEPYIYQKDNWLVKSPPRNEEKRRELNKLTSTTESANYPILSRNLYITPYRENNQKLLGIFDDIKNTYEPYKKLIDGSLKYHRINFDHNEDEDVKKFIVNQINKRSNKRFILLDKQWRQKSLYTPPGSEETTIKYKYSLFIVDNKSQKVNDKAINIKVTVVKHDEKLGIPSINFVEQKQKFGSDKWGHIEFEDTGNKYRNAFHIENEMHLEYPYKTDNSSGALFSFEENQEILDKHGRGLKNPKYQCYSKDENVIKSTGEDYSQCMRSNGLWEKPVESIECPFYEKNKNYNNRRGGRTPDGKCEMPSNVKRIGTRSYSQQPDNKPWCYNCKVGADGMPGTAGPCCDEQQNRPDIYTNLNSPDYMFPGDSIERGYDRKTLISKNLNWEQSPSRVTYKDTRYPDKFVKKVNNKQKRVQKQPVFGSFISNSKTKFQPGKSLKVKDFN